MLDAYLPLGLTLDGLLAGLVGALVFMSVLITWRGLVEARPKLARARSITRRRLELAAQAASSRPRPRPERQASLPATIARRLRLLQTSQAEKIRDRLLRAGFRSREAMATFLVAKLLCPTGFVGLAFLLVHVLGLGNVPPEFRPPVLAGAVLLGFFSPDLYLANVTAKRRQALQKALPDGLDLLVICAEAGLSLDAALHRVAEEMAHASPSLADELALTSVELNFLPDRRSALLNLAKRVDLQAVRGVVSTLVQTEKYGTPLAQSLRVLSGEFREQRMLRAEEKAARLPAILTVPMIVFILPTLFIVLLGPAIIDVYDNLIR
jgi:tight adherence protein C